MKILIVDDDAVSRMILQRFLAAHGDCVCAEHGPEGMALFGAALESGEPFDLVCMDIQMPGMSGPEALALMREGEKRAGVAPGREAKAVMVTCHDDVKNVCASFFQGQATCYLTKPLSQDVLVETLRREKIIP